MDDGSLQRGPESGPSWGPPARRTSGRGPALAGAAPSAPTAMPADDSGPPETATATGRDAETIPPSHGPPPPPPPTAQWHQYSPGPATNRSGGAGSRLVALGPTPRWIVAATIVAAALLQLGLRTRLNSVATLLAVAVLIGLVIEQVSRRRPTVVFALGFSLLGACVAVVRASAWVTVPALLMTASCLVLAGQGRPFATRFGTATKSYLQDMAVSPRWLLQPLHGRRRDGLTSLGRGVVLAAIAVVPLAMLLASADAVFGQLLASVDPGRSWQHAALTAMVLPFLAPVVIAARRTSSTIGATAAAPSRTTIGRSAGGSPISMTEATVVLGSVGLLLAIWGATQIVVALGGADRLLATANLTAAENARQGFFQLVAATAFLIVIIIAIDRLTARTSRADHVRFLGLSVLIAVETLGVVAATYSRLSLYISGFGNTMLRASVAWFLGWLAVVLVVLVVSVNLRSRRTEWFGAAVFALAAFWVLAFGVWNPEASVARGNLERSDQAAAIDYRYLGRELGPDAVPTLVALLPNLDAEQRDKLADDLCRQADDLGGGYRLLSWNRSHAQAAEALETLGC